MANDSNSAYRKYWLLDQKITFLNHGSFGASPIPVLEYQTQLRQQIEREPVHFFIREWEPLLDEARANLALFLGANRENLVFVPNATTGINAVLRSLSFSANDELLTTNQEYNACRNVLNFVAQRDGAKIVVASLPFPINSPQEVIAAILGSVTPQTKLVLIDHIVSQTGLILPIPELIKELTKRGIDTLIDGAHAPGMIPLNLEEIGATYYTGNCHKWLCAPKGAGFLYVRPDRQSLIYPTTISHGANSPRTDKSPFLLQFDWMGTDDPTPYLCVPKAIEFMGNLLKGGWAELMANNHQLAVEGRQIISQIKGVTVPAPETMIGTMGVVILPKIIVPEKQIGLIPILQEILWQEFQIEVPIIPWPDPDQLLIRVSAQIYNTRSEYEYLAQSIEKLINRYSH